MHKYQNLSTGQIVSFPRPHARLERSPRWEKLNAPKAAADEALAEAKKPAPRKRAASKPAAKKSGGKTAAAAAPPKVGAGSGRAAWAAYAETIGIQVAEGMSRSEIWAAVEAKAKG